MYIRIVQATIKPKRVLEFKDAVANHDLPIVRGQPGFLDHIAMYADNQFISMTFWETEEDAERFTSEVFPRIAARSGPLVLKPLRAEAYKAEHDTADRLRSGTVETMEKRSAIKFATPAAA
jgi:heme-degrading monooxygenase HmoA